MKYAELVGPKSVKGSIRSWTNYGALDAEGCLLDAQAYLFNRIRTRQMRKSYDFTQTLNEDSHALPSDYLDPIRLDYRDGLGRVHLTDADTLMATRPYNSDGTLQSGTPFTYAVFDDAMQWEFKVNQARPCKLLYFAQPALLSASNQTNWLTDRYPHVLRAACMMQAENMRQNTDEFTRWARQLEAHVMQLNITDDLSLRGGEFATSPGMDRRYYV